MGARRAAERQGEASLIRVDRPAEEPPNLAAARATRLPRCREDVALRGTIDPAGLCGYEVVRATLFAAQHHKCCYCERALEQSDQAVEHYRPKATYWWLCWSWVNLLFVCEPCNRHKGRRFPLLAGRPLLAEESPPGRERPCLLDPASADDECDPLRHVVFRLVAGRWVPVPRAGSRRGYETIRLCALDRNDLLDLYQKHAIMMATVIHRIGDADRTQLGAVWSEETRRWLSPAAPFAALSHDILDHHFPAVFRRKHGLQLTILDPPEPNRRRRAR